MSEVSVMNQVEEPLVLPPGFRFHPTDEEIVSHYLSPKAVDRRFTSGVMGEVDLNKCEPWDLPGRAKMGEKEWYFFCHKDRKYPTGMRTNRATECGYWKATGKDKEIFRGKGLLVGMKKTLVFYRGRAPRGEKTSWVMHEYRLEGRLPHHLPRSAKDEWAVCRVFDKSLGAKNGAMAAAAEGTGGGGGDGLERVNSFAFLEDFLDSADLPPLMDPAPFYGSGADATTSGAHHGVPGTNYQAAVKAEEPHFFYAPQSVAAASPYFSLPPAAASAPAPAIRRYCKAEQQHSGFSASRDTGATEISSVLDDLSSDPAMDLTDIWKY